MRRHFGGAATARALPHALARVGALALVGMFSLAGGALAASIADSRVDSAGMADWLPPAVAAPAAPQAAAPALPQEIMLPVAATAIAPGDTITDSMLIDRAFPAHVVDTYPLAISRSQIVGKVARRVLMAGTAIPVAAVGDAKLVTRGIATELRFEQDGLVITAIGVPLESGTAGAVVRLKNADSGKIVTGIVQADGSVKVGGK